MDGSNNNNGRVSKILSNLMEKKVIGPLETVYYRSKRTGERMAEGLITVTGISCNCCGEMFNLSKFETHAGSTNHRPSSNIFLGDGRSIADCLLQLKRQNQPEPEPEPEPIELGGEEEENELGFKKNEGFDRNLMMMSGVIACYIIWKNGRGDPDDDDVYRFLALFVSQIIFMATFFLVLTLLNQ